MKLIMFCLFKGGSGKTMALMALSSALVSDGKTVALFDADDNRSLTTWMESAKGNGPWDEICAVSTPPWRANKMISTQSNRIPS